MRAVLFDMDDTLVHLDVDWAEVRAEMEECLRQHGEGGEVADSIEASIIDAGGKMKGMLLEVQERHEANGWQNATLMPHAKETLDALKGEYLLGIVTGNGRDVAEKIIEKFGLEGYFGTVKTREDGIKPLPTGVIAALDELGCDPSDAVFVGNGVSDMEAARIAGVTPIGITNTYPEERLREMGAEKIISDLIELKELLE